MSRATIDIHARKDDKIAVRVAVLDPDQFSDCTTFKLEIDDTTVTTYVDSPDVLVSLLTDALTQAIQCAAECNARAAR